MSSVMNWIWPKYKISRSSIENVCFKGGGMKGNAFVGVARAMDELGMWPQIKRFIGSSAGAIFAGICACRIPHTTIDEEIKKVKYSKFKDSSWGLPGEGIRLIEKLGMYEGNYFYNWYRDLLEKYVGNPDITLEEIYQRFNSEIVITTTDLTKMNIVYMTRETHPDTKLCDAVRKSMSIPVFYVPITETDADGVKHVYVDGGCTDNFPLEYFDSLYSSKSEAFGKTMGFDLERGTVETDPTKYYDHTANINSIIDLVTTLINTTIETIERTRLDPLDTNRIVHINTKDYKTTNFDMPEKDIQDLITIGYNATLKFFANLN